MSELISEPHAIDCQSNAIELTDQAITGKNLLAFSHRVGPL
jgi:hypothetical protein